MSKKNKKKPGGSPSGVAPSHSGFDERLARCWEKRDWAAFVTLFQREPRERALQALAAKYWQATLYNCLTTFLFVEKDRRGTLMAAEAALTEGAGTLIRDCARVALDFWRLVDQGYIESLTPLEYDEELPAPFQRLHHQMEARQKVWRRQSSELKSLVEKFARQFRELSGAKTLVRYTTFLKTAQALELQAAGTPAVPLFRALTLVASLVREVHQPRHPLRDLGDLYDAPELSELAKLAFDHPVFDVLWDFFCRAGGARYGEEWERAARALLLMCVKGKRESLPRLVLLQMDLLDAASRLLMSSGDSRVPMLLLARFLFVDEHLWGGREAYVLGALAFFAIDDEMHKANVGRRAILSIFKALVQQGKIFRPEAPLPRAVLREMPETLEPFPLSLVQELLRHGLPGTLLPDPVLLRLALEPGCRIDKMPPGLTARFPLRFPDTELLRSVVSAMSPALAGNVLRQAQRVLDEGSFQALLDLFFWHVVDASLTDEAKGVPLARQNWGSVGGDALRLLADSLPQESPAGCFCRLCAGVRRFALSNAPLLVEAFFAALPKRAGEDYFDLYLWLLTWPDVDVPFLMRLAEKTYDYCRKNREWMDVAETLSSLGNKPRRRLLAQETISLWLQLDHAQKPHLERTRALETLSLWAEHEV